MCGCLSRNLPLREERAMSTQVQLGLQSGGELFDHGFELIDYAETKEEGKCASSETKQGKSSVNDLVGCRLEFQWTSGKWYRGTICKYDSEKKLHHVLYDDGEQKWYYLPEMVFRFVKEEDEWIKC